MPCVLRSPNWRQSSCGATSGEPPHLRGKYEHWRPQGAWQTEEQFSDGTLRLMGLLWVAMEGVGPLLLEEPELSLHPEIVRSLPQMLARVQLRTGKQIILSTHSSDLLQDDGIALDEVLLLRPGTEGTDVRPASAFDEIPGLLAGGLTLADAIIPKTRPDKAAQLTLTSSLLRRLGVRASQRRIRTVCGGQSAV